MQLGQALRRLARPLLLAAAAWGAAPAQALDIDFGNAAPYSVYVFEDLTGLVAAGGRLAVGGNLSLGSVSVGAGLGAGTPGVASLLVRGNIQGFSGPLLAGSAPGFGLFVGTKAASVTAALDLRKVSLLPVNFDADRVYLGAMSEQLRDLAATGTATASGSTLTLAGRGAALEVFTLTAAQAAAAQRVVVSGVAADAHIVVNLAADSLRRIVFGIDTSALAPWLGRVLFNAHDAETLQFNGLTLWGSLLATNACICTSTGTLKGSAVVRKWTAAMTVDFVPFVPKP